MLVPLASAVGVMVHVSLLPYCTGKLNERMQFLAVGSTVQGPELMMKNCALVKPTIMIKKAAHGPPMRGRPEGRPEGYKFASIFWPCVQSCLARV
jgi:hypothetical protein